MSLDDVGERGYIIFYSVHFMNLLLLHLCNKDFDSRNQEYRKTVHTKCMIKDGIRAKQYIEIVMWINIVLTIFIPLYRFQATLFRITRNLMIINYSGLLVYNQFSINNGKKRIINVAYIALVVFLFYFEIVRGDNSIRIFKPILVNNWLN